MPREDALQAFERAAGLPVGSMSRTPEEAAQRGYDCIAHELAATLGLSPQQFRGALLAATYRRR